MVWLYRWKCKHTWEIRAPKGGLFADVEGLLGIYYGPKATKQSCTWRWILSWLPRWSYIHQVLFINIQELSIKGNIYNNVKKRASRERLMSMAARMPVLHQPAGSGYKIICSARRLSHLYCAYCSLLIMRADSHWEQWATLRSSNPWPQYAFIEAPLDLDQLRATNQDGYHQCMSQLVQSLLKATPGKAFERCTQWH